MKIPFKIYSPGGNITALVETTVLMDFAAVAKQIMASDSSIEQVGFIMPSRTEMADFHLEMMGGEFCANAARCAALCHSNLADKTSAVFTVSGFDAPLTANVQGQTVSLRIPGEFVRSIKKVKDGWLVDLYGIRFLVTDEPLEKNAIETAIKNYGQDVPAMGVIILQTSALGYAIVPWVWVKSTATLIKETACASGSLAASLVIREQGLNIPTYSILQPSGSVLAVGLEQQFLDVTISGMVEKVGDRVLDIR